MYYQCAHTHFGNAEKEKAKELKILTNWPYTVLYTKFKNNFHRHNIVSRMAFSTFLVQVL